MGRLETRAATRASAHRPRQGDLIRNRGSTEQPQTTQSKPGIANKTASSQIHYKQEIFSPTPLNSINSLIPMRIHPLTIALSIGLAAPQTITPPKAFSQASESNKPAFRVVDIDGNGQISLQEAGKVGINEQTFKRADVDNSGFLSVDEYQALQNIA
jgi:hypothetical protein